MADIELVRYVQNPIGFGREFRSWNGSVGRALRKTTIATDAIATATAPRQTGRLAASTTTSYTYHGAHRDLESQIIAMAPYAIMVVKGTKPHVIRPKRAPRLVFFWPKVGRVVSFTKVNHPGTKANNYLLAALKRAVRATL